MQAIQKTLASLGRCAALLSSVCLAALSLHVHAADKPNILVIWGDDIGVSNISAYTFGLVGYKTPNIDRIAKE
ncbi:MAG: arylsulfatase, partial [Halieaceae bacterium]|nr:arylsulfatase [Halieaceae bacterium]